MEKQSSNGETPFMKHFFKLQAYTFLKEQTPVRLLPCEFRKNYQNSFFNTWKRLEISLNLKDSIQEFFFKQKCSPVYFYFFQGMFFTRSFLKSALHKLENDMSFQDFLFAVNCIGLKTVSLMSWILQTSKIRSITVSFRASRIFDTDSS